MIRSVLTWSPYLHTLPLSISHPPRVRYLSPDRTGRHRVRGGQEDLGRWGAHPPPEVTVGRRDASLSRRQDALMPAQARPAAWIDYDRPGRRQGCKYAA